MWAGAWRLGFAPSPYIFTYLALAFAGLVCVLSLRGVTGTLAATPNWWSMAARYDPYRDRCQPVPAAQICDSADRAVLVGPAAGRRGKTDLRWRSMASPRSSARMGSGSDRQSLRTVAPDPVIASVQGGNAAFLDNEIARPDRLCSRVVPAWRRRRDGFSSAGPIFYDRLFGGTAFAALRETLQSRGAWVALAESDRDVGLSGLGQTRDCRRNFRSAVDSRRHQRLDFACLARDGTSRSRPMPPATSSSSGSRQ